MEFMVDCLDCWWNAFSIYSFPKQKILSLKHFISCVIIYISFNAYIIWQCWTYLQGKRTLVSWNVCVSLFFLGEIWIYVWVGCDRLKDCYFSRKVNKSVGLSVWSLKDCMEVGYLHFYLISWYRLDLPIVNCGGSRHSWFPSEKERSLYMVIGLNIATFPEQSKRKKVWASLLELCVGGISTFIWFRGLACKLGLCFTIKSNLIFFLQCETPGYTYACSLCSNKSGRYGA